MWGWRIGFVTEMTFIGRDESLEIDEIVDVWMAHWVRDRNDIHWFVVFGRQK